MTVKQATVVLSCPSCGNVPANPVHVMRGDLIERWCSTCRNCPTPDAPPHNERIEVTEHESLTGYARQKVIEQARQQHIAYLRSRVRGATEAEAEAYWWKVLDSVMEQKP